MVYWETADTVADLPPFLREYMAIWKAADKIVFSSTLSEPSSVRTKIEPKFDAAAVRRLKENAPRDLSISGAELAAHALRGGVLDEIGFLVNPAVVGGGKRALPDDVRATLRLLDTRRFANGVVWLRYAVVSS